MATPRDKTEHDIKQANEKLRQQKLTQMREAWLREHGDQSSVPAAQEQIFETEVDAEMQAEAGPEAALKKGLSKITDTLAKGRFAFVGKLLEKIFGMITSMIPIFKSLVPALQSLGAMFNPSKPAKRAEPDEELKLAERARVKISDDSIEGLVAQSRLKEADNLLSQQEQQLFAQMKTVFNEVENKPVEDPLQGYRNVLDGLAKEIHELGENPTENYMKDNLKTRIEYYEKYSPEAQKILETHASKAGVDAKIAILTSNNLPEDRLEEKGQSDHLSSLGSELQKLTAKQTDLQEHEMALLQNLPVVFNSLKQVLQNHQTVFEQEKQQQSAAKPN